MKHIRTMAVEITESNYPVAVACLPATFALIPVEEVIGNVLVINALEPMTRSRAMQYGYGTRRMESETSVTLQNLWMPLELFKEEYKYTSPGRKSGFAEVVKVKDLVDPVSRRLHSVNFRSVPRIVHVSDDEFPDTDD